MQAGITVLIPFHGSRMRNGMLNRAFISVTQQVLQPAAILLYNDTERHGVGRSRQVLVDQVQTEWLAWIDSDDEWMPHHLETMFKVTESADDINYE